MGRKLEAFPALSQEMQMCEDWKGAAPACAWGGVCGRRGDPEAEVEHHSQDLQGGACAFLLGGQKLLDLTNHCATPPVGSFAVAL